MLLQAQARSWLPPSLLLLLLLLLPPFTNRAGL
jgi:hypothetical protein